MKVLDHVNQACQHTMELLTDHDQVMREYRHSDPVMQQVRQAVRTQVPYSIAVNLSLHMGPVGE